MVEIRQLELDLFSVFAAAEQAPEEADLAVLWSQFAEVMDELPLQDQLRVGGMVLDQLAELCQTKAEFLWEDWQDAHNTEGPVLDEEWLQGLVRQSHHVDVSELVKPMTRYREGTEGEASVRDESVVGEVDKVNILAMVDDIEAVEQTKQSALGVAHDENASAWSQRISAYLENQSESVKLVELQHQLQRPLIELWLGALLGGFTIEQRGEFYENQQVWISLTSVNKAVG
ncbi:MAG: hypothetical protein AAF921_01515 [Cyanobacteria bacterium P01_D01_bin.44]